MSKCLVLFVEGDTEVFELSPKLPIKWNEVERDLRANGAADVIHVEARHSIEDWFLYDAEGIISFLRLNKKTKVTGKDGYDKLKRLYKQANKIVLHENKEDAK